MLKETCKRIVESAYGHYIVDIVLTTNINASRKKFDSIFTVPYTGTNAMGLHCSTGTGHSVIFLPFNASPTTVAHESWHCVWAVFEYIGDLFGNETAAYLLTDLMDQIIVFQKKSKKKPAKKKGRKKH